MSRLTYPGPQPISPYGDLARVNIGGFGQQSTGLNYPSPTMSMPSAPATGGAGAGGAGTGYQMKSFPSAQLTMDDVPDLQAQGANSPVTSTSGSADDSTWRDSSFWGEDGFNLGSVQAIAGTIGAFGNIWNGWKQNKLAQDALEFKEDAYQTNLQNQRKSFNLALEDRIRSRAAFSGRGQASADDYIKKHRMGD